MKTRKVYDRCSDSLPADVDEFLCDETSDDSYRRVYVDKPLQLPIAEKARQWFLANGAKESDGFVLLHISW